MPQPRNEQQATSISSVTGMLTVIGDDPVQSGPPIFANFVAVSHVASEVQLEFIFLDINTLATQIDQVKKGAVPADFTMRGKTVAKIVVPAASFVQLRNHLSVMFDKLEGKHGAQHQQEETSSEGDDAR